LPLPILEEQTDRSFRFTGHGRYVEATAEQAVEELMTLWDAFPEWTIGQVWEQWLGVLCPLSLVTPADHWLLARETELREYGIPPYPGATVDQPTVVLEAFAAIRDGRAQAEQDAAERLRQRLKETR
jgi:hypothetical protein